MHVTSTPSPICSSVVGCCDTCLTWLVVVGMNNIIAEAWLCQIRMAKGAAEELLAHAEVLGAVEQWQEPTSLRQRWRDASYAAAWSPGLYWPGEEAGGVEESLAAG